MMKEQQRPISDDATDNAITMLEAALAILRRHRDQQPDSIEHDAPCRSDSLKADSADDDAALTDHDYLDTIEASERFNVPSDTLRYWARRHGIGRRIGGRWQISISRTKEILGLR